MQDLFFVDTRHHGKGPVVFEWSPAGSHVASAGTSCVVHVFDRRGEMIDQIVPSAAGICTALKWNRDGSMLAIMQQSSATVVLWELQTRKTQSLDINMKDLTFLQWSKVSTELAIGTGKGALIIYDNKTGRKTTAKGKHKKRIVCGDWNSENKLAYASEDRQITITAANGETLDQVKVKCRPLNVTFGGKENDEESIVAVNMEGRSILLYDLNERDNALELAFQQRYGSIVSYRWFGDGYIMAGFSSGYVVVISTHMHEIGREQFCAKFHNDHLRDIAYCPAVQKVATLGDNGVKVIDMADNWKVILENPFPSAQLERVAWADNGNILSISCSRHGCVYNFSMPSNDQSSQSGRPTSHAAMSSALMPMSPLTMLMLMLLVGNGTLGLEPLACCC